MERGEFDDLPGRGKPIDDLGAEHDPDWWVKKLIEREQITGVLPPALALRKDDAELDGRLDKITTEREVRREVEDFNERVRKADLHPAHRPAAPPVITKRRDVEAEVEAWRERRTARVEAQRAALVAQQPEPRRRWWQRDRRSVNAELCQLARVCSSHQLLSIRDAWSGARGIAHTRPRARQR